MQQEQSQQKKENETGMLSMRNNKSENTPVG
jgi:hypothetical protein